MSDLISVRLDDDARRALAELEATPVVWRGSIYVGTRDGRVHALR